MNTSGSSSDTFPEFPENREQRLFSIPIIRELSGKVGNRDFSQSQLSGNCPGKSGTETGLSPDFPDCPKRNQKDLF